MDVGATLFVKLQYLLLITGANMPKLVLETPVSPK